MTRTYLGLLVLSMVGCSTGESQFSHEAEVGVSSRGVALSHEGSRSQVGMAGTTCAIDTRTAAIGSDLDYDDSDEVVQDAALVDDRDIFLIQSEGGLHMQSSTALAFAEPTMLGSFQDGRVFADGIVGLDQAEHLQWSTGGDADVSGLRSFDVDTAGQVFVADGDLYRVTPDERVNLASNVAQVAVDETAGVLYAVDEGGSSLRLLELDGTLRASVDLGGEILDLAAMGDRGAAVAVVSHGSSGELVLVDGATGEISAWVGTPTPADGVKTSGGGEMIAVTLPGSIHFFSVE
ncbi:MAG: hypothetical protein KC912_06250 [Proteobacteria bacterium]|nr:hypothetical protein [Pseudomonadota bacterium]